MAENRLLTLDERLAIEIKCGQLRDEGKEEEARELTKTKPMPAYMAKILMEKVYWARISCEIADGTWRKWRLSMEGWLDEWNNRSGK